MKPLKAKLARRAVRSTAKHFAHGAAAKLRRSPIRAATLLGVGGALGALAGWLIGREPPVPNPVS